MKMLQRATFGSRHRHQAHRRAKGGYRRVREDDTDRGLPKLPGRCRYNQTVFSGTPIDLRDDLPAYKQDELRLLHAHTPTKLVFVSREGLTGLILTDGLPLISCDADMFRFSNGFTEVNGDLNIVRCVRQYHLLKPGKKYFETLKLKYDDYEGTLADYE